jgi:hypothetical protein
MTDQVSECGTCGRLELWCASQSGVHFMHRSSQSAPAWTLALMPDSCVTLVARLQLEASLRCSLVLVDVDIPLVALSDGVHARSFAGNGVVVYHGERVGGGGEGMGEGRSCRDI